MAKCLDSVFNCDYSNFEVIFVDNASTDGSVEFVRSNFHEYSNLRIIRNNRNLGFAEGNNVGAKVAKGEYIVFLNVDTKVDPNWLKELVTVMESDKSIGAAQSKLLLFDGRTIDSAGDFINFYGFGWMRGHGEIDRGQFNKIDEIFSARGAAMIVRKKVLEEVGYFDADFFMTCEDVDLSWRIRLRGYKVMFVPRSVVYHFGSGIRRDFQETTQSYYYNVRNTFMMLIKNYDIKNLTPAILTYLATEFSMFILSLPFVSKRRYNFARIRALLWILLNLKSVWRKRSVVQHSVRRSFSGNNVKNVMIKGRSPFLDISWNILYRRFMTYDRFINYQVYMRNKWVL